MDENPSERWVKIPSDSVAVPSKVALTSAKYRSRSCVFFNSRCCSCHRTWCFDKITMAISTESRIKLPGMSDGSLGGNKVVMVRKNVIDSPETTYKYRSEYRSVESKTGTM